MKNKKVKSAAGKSWVIELCDRISSINEIIGLSIQIGDRTRWFEYSMSSGRCNKSGESESGRHLGRRLYVQEATGAEKNLFLLTYIEVSRADESTTFSP